MGHVDTKKRAFKRDQKKRFLSVKIDLVDFFSRKLMEESPGADRRYLFTTIRDPGSGIPAADPGS